MSSPNRTERFLDRSTRGEEAGANMFREAADDREVLISVTNVSKKFCKNLRRSMAYGVIDLSKNLFGMKHDSTHLRSDEFWAVEDVSFELRRGESLGLIGVNGSGKSTLLRLIAGLLPPDQGSIAIKGRIGALISLGAGFHPHMTGRENIYLNGSILGMSQKEIRAKFEEIVEFAGISEFLEAPVSTYSSGMRVRLGFSIAIHVNPDILLIDEVLAVGDVGFRSKCYNAIYDIANRASIVFVSHSMPMISRLSQKTILLDKGSQVFLGPTTKAINLYNQLQTDRDYGFRTGSGDVQFERVRFLDKNGRESKEFDIGEIFRAEMQVESKYTIQSLIVDLAFRTIGNELFAECNNYVQATKISLDAGERACIELSIPNLILNPGSYKIAVILMSHNMVNHFDWIGNVGSIEVTGGRPATGTTQFIASWTKNGRRLG